MNEELYLVRAVNVGGSIEYQIWANKEIKDKSKDVEHIIRQIAILSQLHIPKSEIDE